MVNFDNLNWKTIHMISETQNFSSMKSKIELDAVFTLFWILTTELTEQNLKWCKICISQPDALECNVFGNVLNLEKKFTNTCCFFKLEFTRRETKLTSSAVPDSVLRACHVHKTVRWRFLATNFYKALHFIKWSRNLLFLLLPARFTETGSLRLSTSVFSRIIVQSL